MATAATQNKNVNTTSKPVWLNFVSPALIRSKDYTNSKGEHKTLKSISAKVPEGTFKDQIGEWISITVPEATYRQAKATYASGEFADPDKFVNVCIAPFSTAAVRISYQTGTELVGKGKNKTEKKVYTQTDVRADRLVANILASKREYLENRDGVDADDMPAAEMIED